MNRWSQSLLRIVFAFVIVFLAAGVGLSVRVVFRSQSERVFGIAFLCAVVGLVFFFRNLFPSVYLYPKQWWLRPGRGPEAIVAVTFAFIVIILSSRIATLWFVILVISGVLVALLLHVTRRSGEL